MREGQPGNRTVLFSARIDREPLQESRFSDVPDTLMRTYLEGLEPALAHNSEFPKRGNELIDPLLAYTNSFITEHLPPDHLKIDVGLAESFNQFVSKKNLIHYEDMPYQSRIVKGVSREAALAYGALLEEVVTGRTDKGDRLCVRRHGRKVFIHAREGIADAAREKLGSNFVSAFLIQPKRIEPHTPFAGNTDHPEVVTQENDDDFPFSIKTPAEVKRQTMLQKIPVIPEDVISGEFRDLDPNSLQILVYRLIVRGAGEAVSRYDISRDLTAAMRFVIGFLDGEGRIQDTYMPYPAEYRTEEGIWELRTIAGLIQGLSNHEDAQWRLKRPTFEALFIKMKTIAEKVGYTEMEIVKNTLLAEEGDVYEASDYTLNL